MARTPADTWTITESVGSSALSVAAARAAETERDRPLIVDPYARVFLDAVGDGPWSRFALPNTPASGGVDSERSARTGVMIDYVASRTAYFDA